MTSIWEISWDGAEKPLSGSESTLPEARSAAEQAASGVSDLWKKPGVYVRITGPSGGVWRLMPTRQKVGQVSWQRASRRTARVPEPLRVVAGIDVPKLLQDLRAIRAGRGPTKRPHPACAAAVAVIKALGGAAA